MSPHPVSPYSGKVLLVGAGPGDPELLTFKAAKAISRATVILVDDLVNEAVLSHARPSARIVQVGKRGGCKSTPQAFIEKLMIMAAKEGETVFNLSRRFGVPANVIMRVNGLSEQSGLQAGQKVIIPTYVYSSKAPVSAPDSNPKVAASSSSTGLKKDVPTQKAPVPEKAPDEKVAEAVPAGARPPSVRVWLPSLN